MPVVTLKESVEHFWAHLKASNRADSTVQSYCFALNVALPRWLFSSLPCRLLSHEHAPPELEGFIQWARIKRAGNCAGDAAAEYKSSLLAGRKKWEALVFDYGKKTVLGMVLETFRFLLLRILSEGLVIFSQKATKHIVRFVKYLHSRGFLLTVLPWENKEGWKRKLEQVLEESAGGSASRSSSPAELLLAYLNFCHCEKELTLKSLRHEHRYLETFFRWAEPFELSRFNAPLIKKFVEELCTKGLAWVSVRHHFHTLKGFASFLVEAGILAENPTRSIRLKANERQMKDVLSFEERNGLLSAPARLWEGPVSDNRAKFFLARDRCILHLFAATGIRLAEIAGLKLEDVDLADKTLHIRGKGSRTYLEKGRVLFLDDPGTYQALAGYLEVRKELACPWLFVTEDGFRLMPHSFQQVVKKYGRIAGIKRNVSPVLLRASFASWMIEKGVDPVALCRSVGHDVLLGPGNHVQKALPLFIAALPGHEKSSTYGIICIQDQHAGPAQVFRNLCRLAESQGNHAKLLFALYPGPLFALEAVDRFDPFVHLCCYRDTKKFAEKSN
ncbi:MAG: hypothetical protein C4554_02260 [Dethiobacter sp.]|jgi:site-specific recombinase XerD|nr:MAG: hypothetical protein C4554_02260 [Dethiobacter sp.]